jgi:hypothetical protein
MYIYIISSILGSSVVFDPNPKLYPPIYPMIYQFYLHKMANPSIFLVDSSISRQTPSPKVYPILPFYVVSLPIFGG